MGEMSESHRDVNADYTRTVVYSSTTSQIEGQGYNYATDNTSHVVQPPLKEVKEEAPRESGPAPAATQSPDSSALKSRNDALPEQPKDQRTQEEPVPLPQAEDRVQSEEPNELEQFDDSRNAHAAYTILDGDSNAQLKNTKFISFNDSQQISKHSRTQNLHSNSQTMNFVSGGTQQSVEKNGSSQQAQQPPVAPTIIE